jgi:hypothetical protein
MEVIDDPKPTALNGRWKKLWPEAVTSVDSSAISTK